MDFEPEVTATSMPEATEFAEPPERSAFKAGTLTPLELLRDTEGLLRRKTLATLTPVLPPPVASSLQDASEVADESLNQLAEIDLDEISDEELKPARILIGLTFSGFGALFLVLLLLYLYLLHPELSPAEQVREYWYQYIWFVCLGVAGMMMLGREAMRPKN